MVLESAIGFLTSDLVRTIVFEIILFIVAGLFIWIGAWFARIKKRTFIKAIIAAFLTAFVSSILILPFSQFALIAVTISLIINIAVIKFVFSTTWRNSLVTWIFSVIAHVVILVALVLIAAIF
ncbi:MAG: hypothetical protein KKB03_01190 [Nanoarchaeota archaeon]|nr:hypothetical protein [Nanoarchaeota archaeon]MBU1135870.1 hypothetical protein [Nanoarchaeota archaeon]MBU2519842.1 hypothetical protein [Nanoarchaeota archaeon]